MSRRLIPLLLSVIMLCTALFSGCGSKAKRFETTITGCFDTVITIVAYMDSKEAFNKEVEAITKELAVYDGLSDAYELYSNGNNIKTINDNAGNGNPVKVNLLLVDMLLTAKKAYEATNGAVNVAMGSVTSIWRAYISNGMNDENFAKAPSVEALKAAAEHTDINKLIIDAEKSTVYLEDKDMRLDVGAFAKGYAASLITYQAKERGVTSLLLNMGGAISAIGSRGDGKAYTIAVQDPRNPETQLVKVNLGDGMTASTSGDYQRFYKMNGIRYHHITDPKTLMPTTNAASVTVLSADSISGDYLSTALMAMPQATGAEIVESLKDVEAMWVFEDGTVIYSSGFNQYIENK